MNSPQPQKKKYDWNPETKAHYAFCLWDKLTSIASKKKVIFYWQAGEFMKKMHARSVGWPLDPIQEYCIARKLPPLTRIVVHNNTDQPGNNYEIQKTLEEDKKDVFEYCWKEEKKPSEEELKWHASNYNPDFETEARFLWHILIFASSKNRTLSYEEVGCEMKINQRQVGRPLGTIQRYCIDNGLPPLTRIVVRKGTDQPGDNYKIIETLAKDKKNVFRKNWEKEKKPSQNDFKKYLWT